jgi:MurNAc alpha-1-phosphate uridylyltransferase
MARALVLAAGRGERLRPLTDFVPKPLLVAGGKSLIQWQVENLARAGFRDLVVNHAHLGDLIERALGDGSRFGVRIAYSQEVTALETAGGIVQALPLLGTEPFLVVSSDINTAFDYASLHEPIAAIASDPVATTAHFVLVDNPSWHAAGDMGLADGRVTRAGPKLTYGGISVFHPAMFAGMTPGTHLKLFPWAYDFVDEGRVSGERFSGAWDNVGTPGHLEALDRRLSR